MSYLKERFPVLTYLLLVGAMTSSGLSLYGPVRDSLLATWFASAVGLLLFFFELRLMDELKDYEKDRVAYPNRPLPRGLITLSEVRNVIGLGVVLMLILSILLAAFWSAGAGGVYFLTTAYLWLMFKEFYCGPLLSKKPFLYGFTHQAILLLLMAFPSSLAYPDEWLQPRTLWLGLTALGGFFTYELCRKLDPWAHPVLFTYPQAYGRFGTLFRILITASIGILGATLLHVDRICAPVMSIVVAAAIAWSLKPELHRITELMATFGLLVSLSCIPLSKLF